MTDGIRANPEALTHAASQLREKSHASRRAGQELSDKTSGSRHHGTLGEAVKAIETRLFHAVSKVLSEAESKLYDGVAKGAEKHAAELRRIEQEAKGKYDHVATTSVNITAVRSIQPVHRGSAQIDVSSVRAIPPRHRSGPVGRAAGVNPTHGRVNCSLCTDAYVRRTQGDMTAVAGGDSAPKLSWDELQARHGGGNAWKQFHSSDMKGVTSEAQALQPGEQGMIGVSDGKVSHVFNVENHQGTIVYTDAQGNPPLQSSQLHHVLAGNGWGPANKTWSAFLKVGSGGKP